MKILVLGASGQVGHALMKVGKRRGHSIAGTYRLHPQIGLEQLDLVDANATRRMLHTVQPDWVVDCASWVWADGNEKDPKRAQRENVDTVTVAAAAASEVGARWCYLSTSYVFDGTQSEPYSESDRLSPLSVYARTKVQAEEITRAHFGDQGLIVRTILVWGPDPQCKNFAYQLVRCAMEKQTMRIPSDQLGNPTYGPDFASAIVQLLERSEGGIWNVAGPEAQLDRVGFARLLCRGLGLADEFIEPVTTVELGQAAERPLNGALCTKKLDAAGLSLRSTAAALEDWRHAEWDWPWQGL